MDADGHKCMAEDKEKESIDIMANAEAEMLASEQIALAAAVNDEEAKQLQLDADKRQEEKWNR